MSTQKSVYRSGVHFLNEFEGIFGELSSSSIISYVTLLSLEIISVQEKMTKINTVTTRQLGEITIVRPFRLSEHSGPLYHFFISPLTRHGGLVVFNLGVSASTDPLWY
jgi:hypothetical protein